MSTEEFLRNYEEALHDLAKAKIKIKVLKLNVKLTTNVQPVGFKNEQKSIRNRMETFIESHPDLEPEDIEFLRKGEATTAEVANYLTDNSILEVHRDTVARKIGTWYSPGPNDSKSKRTVDPISVIERHFYRGDPETTKKRNLGGDSHP